MKLRRHDLHMLKYALARLCSRATDAIAIGYTADEVLDLFVPPEDHDFCRRAGAYFKPDESWIRVGVNYRVKSGNDCHVAWRTDFRPRFHKLPSISAIRPDAPDHLRQRLSEWAEERYRIGRVFGLAERMVDKFAEDKTDLSLIKFFWPAIGVVAAQQSRDYDMSDLNTYLQSCRAPRTVPSMPDTFRSACQETSALITAAALLPEVKPPKMDYKVEASFNAETHPYFGRYEPK